MSPQQQGDEVRIPRLISVLASLLTAPGALIAQQWIAYGGDPGGMRYSPLKQITPSNVNKLQVAWQFHTGDVSDGTTLKVHSSFEATPLVIEGIMYLSTPFSRVIALDPETGRQIWSFDPKIDFKASVPLYVSRGVAWWTDGKSSRVILGTLDGRLFSLDPKTGQPDAAFGKGGIVDLRTGVAEDFPDKHLGMTSPPAVYKNVIICGSITADEVPKGPRGDIRGFDARTGKLLWTFHSAARPGEFGGDTWETQSADQRSAVNAWSNLSVDVARGIVYVPLTSPGYDYYGGERKGNDLFSDSLVALDATTGKRLWHFQVIHHDLWDYDLPSQPSLIDVKQNGKNIPAVVVETKSGMVFAFDRITGKPIWPIVETPVPPSDVPDEQASPTQPIPTKPAAFARTRFTEADLTNISTEAHDYCANLLKGTTMGSVYTPVGLEPTLFWPGAGGGANWGSAAFDPETHLLYINATELANFQLMEKAPEVTGVEYHARGVLKTGTKFVDQNGYPCQRPPWGTLTAIDMDTGEFKWQSTLGVVDALTAKGIPPTGISNIGGPLVTGGGLLFIGATNDGRFRAFDKKSGKEIWTTMLPASAHSTPMTYTGPVNKKQYVVIAVGGNGKKYSDLLIAYALP